MALLDDVGPLAAGFMQDVGAFMDPELRGRLGGFQQQAWANFQQPYIAQGVEPPRITFQQMGRYISAAASVARAALELGKSIEQVQRSGIDQTIEFRHLAPDIDSRPPDQQPLGPNYRVRFQADVSVGGMSMQQWFTWEAGANLPSTVQGLLDELNNAGDQFGQGYGGTFDGLSGDVMITTW